jgi:SAM-dependent methyltransferase
MARERGAVVGGVDITSELLEVARERVPDGEFLVGSLDDLPLAGGSYDVAFGVNAFQFAQDPVGALREAARVAPGLVAITTFAEPERCESTALHLAMKNAVDPTGDGYAPYKLSAPGRLEGLLADAGLEPVERGEVPVVWRHDDVEDTILSLLCSAGGARTMDAIGEAGVRAALAPAIAPFVADDGSVSMNNVFRYAVGRVA